MRWWDWSMVATTAAMVALVVGPRLPPGICTGDSGGLQLAAATLGITHPPGFAVYSGIGFVFSRILWFDPAFSVSLLCLAAAVAVVITLVMLQIRLGVPAGLACAVALMFLAHRWVWRDMQIPEVYVPTLAFEAVACYQLLRYRRYGRRRHLSTSALLWGVAVASRPPVVFMLPFVVAAWTVAGRRWETSRRKAMETLLLCVGVGALPGLYRLGYLWIRDRPTTPYNYIEQYNREMSVLPAADAGAGAKLHRIAWHISGRQYAHRITDNRPGFRARTRWLRNQLLPNKPVVFALLVCTAVLGALQTYQRCPAGFWLLTGMGIGGIVYLYVLPVHGDAADTLPVLFSAGVLLGVACSNLFPRETGPVRHALAFGAFLAMGVFTLVDAPSRSRIGASRDASAFLESLDMESLPHNAAVYSTWHWSPALWYGVHVRPKRPDIEIINASIRAWPRLIGDLVNRPIFTTEPFDAPVGFTTEPYRNIWRLVPTAP